MSGKLNIRRAQLSDAALLFRWANDAQVRTNAINRERIRWVDHDLWYRRKMESPLSFIYILELDNVPVGQIRFDLCASGRLLIDYSIDYRFRGQGLGRQIINHGIGTVRNMFPSSMVFRAEVLRDNTASFKVLKSEGFNEIGERQIENRQFVIFEKAI